MSLRLAGVNDLIAAERKYHNKCLNAYTENEKGMWNNLVYCGQDILNQDGNPEDSNRTKQTKIFSVCQDTVYGVSEGRKWTPKHIGLSCTLHQMSRYKQLVNLFHSAGHTLNYHDVLKIDTGLAEKSIEFLVIMLMIWIFPVNFIQIYPVSEGYLRKIPVERRGKYPEPL